MTDALSSASSAYAPAAEGSTPAGMETAGTSSAATMVVRPLNNRLITSDATAQAFAAATMAGSERQRNLVPLTQRLARRHSAREETSQQSSREDSRSLGLSPQNSVSHIALGSSEARPQRSMDTEEGVQHLRTKATAMLRDRILTNRASMKRMATTSATASTAFFAAAVHAVAAANGGDESATHDMDQDSARGEQFEELLERFQLRRLQRSLSNVSLSPDEVPPPALKSARVIPVNSSTIGSAVSVGNERIIESNMTTAPPPQRPAEERTAAINSTSVRARSSLIHRESKIISGIESNVTARSLEGSLAFQSMVHGKRWGLTPRRIRRRLMHRLMTPQSPYSWLFAVRSAIMLTACCVYIVYFPYQIAFLGGRSVAFKHLELTLETVFLLHFFFTFNTSLIDRRGVLITSRPEIARRYLGGWGIPHLLASMPTRSVLAYAMGKPDANIPWGEFLHVMYDSAIRMQQIAHILQLYHKVGKLHVSRSSKSPWGWLLYSRYSHLMRSAWLLGAIVLLAHYFACCWKMLQLPLEGDTPFDGITLQSAIHDYAACFYGAMQLLQGQGLGAETLAQNVFSCFAVLVGSVVLAIIYGHVTMLVSNFNANATHYQRKMEVVFAIMDKMALPAALRERIHQYYQHLWREYESLDGEIVKFSKDLTHNLALEVSLFKYMELTMQVPFWGSCSPDFLKQLVLSLHVRVYLPDDFIMRRGEISDEFYMVSRGVCEITRGKDSIEHCTVPIRPRRRGSASLHSIPPPTNSVEGLSSCNPDRVTGRKPCDPTAIDDTRHELDEHGAILESTRLVRGQSFGEAALLLNYARTANARAVTSVEMCVLGRDAFQMMLARHPEDRKRVVLQMLTWLLTNNEFHRVKCPLKQLVCEVVGEVDPVGGASIDARQAAEWLATTIDPLVDDDSSVSFDISTNLTQQLHVMQAQELAAQNPTSTVEQAPDPVVPVRLTRRSSMSGDPPDPEVGLHLDSLDSIMANLDERQERTLKLLGSLKSRVAASSQSASGYEFEPSAPHPTLTSDHPPADPTADVYRDRRMSFVKQRSSTSPLITEVQPFVDTNSLVRQQNESTPPESKRVLRKLVTRRDSIRASQKQLLRQMTSFIGLSMSGQPQAGDESPTKLADQLFQRKPDDSPVNPQQLTNLPLADDN